LTVPMAFVMGLWEGSNCHVYFNIMIYIIYMQHTDAL
jgi:hypothetical protein